MRRVGRAVGALRWGAALQPPVGLAQRPQGSQAGAAGPPPPCPGVSPWSWPAARPAQPAAPSTAPGSQRPAAGGRRRLAGSLLGGQATTRREFAPSRQQPVQSTVHTPRMPREGTDLQHAVLAHHSFHPAHQGPSRGRDWQREGCTHGTQVQQHVSREGVHFFFHAKSFAARAPRQRIASGAPHRMRALPCLFCRISSATSFLRPFICSSRDRRQLWEEQPGRRACSTGHCMPPALHVRPEHRWR